MSTSSGISNKGLQSKLIVWNNQNGRQLHISKGREFSPQQLTCFSPDGKQVAQIEEGFTASTNRQIIKTLMVVSTPAGKNPERVVIPRQRYPDYDEFADRIIAVRWSSDGTEIIVQGGRDIRRFSPQTGQLLGSFPYRAIHVSEWSTDSLSPDGKIVAYTETALPNSHFTGTRAVLVDTHTAKRTTIPINNEMAKLTFSPHSQFLAVTHASQAKFVRVRDRKHLWTWSGASDDSFHFSTDEKSVVLCNGTVCVARDSQDGHELWRTKSIRSTIFALSPDGKTLAEARPNGQIFLRPLSSRRPYRYICKACVDAAYPVQATLTCFASTLPVPPSRHRRKETWAQKGGLPS